MIISIRNHTDRWNTLRRQRDRNVQTFVSDEKSLQYALYEIVLLSARGIERVLFARLAVEIETIIKKKNEMPAVIRSNGRFKRVANRKHFERTRSRRTLPVLLTRTLILWAILRIFSRFSLVRAVRGANRSSRTPSTWSSSVTTIIGRGGGEDLLPRTGRTRTEND